MTAGGVAMRDAISDPGSVKVKLWKTPLMQNYSK